MQTLLAALLLTTTPALAAEVCITGDSDVNLLKWEVRVGQHPLLKFQMSRDKGTIPAMLLSNDRGELTIVTQEDNGLFCLIAMGSGMAAATPGDVFPAAAEQ